MSACIIGPTTGAVRAFRSKPYIAGPCLAKRGRNHTLNSLSFIGKCASRSCVYNYTPLLEALLDRRRAALTSLNFEALSFARFARDHVAVQVLEQKDSLHLSRIRPLDPSDACRNYKSAEASHRVDVCVSLRTRDDARCNFSAFVSTRTPNGPARTRRIVHDEIHSNVSARTTTSARTENGERERSRSQPLRPPCATLIFLLS